MHKSIYRRMYLRLGIDLDQGVLMGYCGTGIGGTFMDRMKYRVWLISIVLAAVAFGIFYYVYIGNQEKTVTDGTLVYRTEQIREETFG